MMTLLLPVTLLILTAGSALVVVQFHKQQNLETCREGLIQIQNALGEAAQSLLRMNTLAQQLRSEWAINTSQLAAAVAAGQLELIPVLKARRNKILAQQKLVSERQKNIIQQAKIQGMLDLQSLIQKMKKQFQMQKQQTSSWSELRTAISAQSKIKFSFLPVDRKIAPPYRPYLNFQNQQAMALSWIQSYKWNPWLRKFINGEQYRAQCRVSMREGKWSAMVLLDKLSLSLR